MEFKIHLAAARKIEVGGCRKVVVFRFDFLQDHWSNCFELYCSILVGDRMRFQEKILE